MDHHYMCSLADVYQCLESDKASQTSYILQFLWRDLTSSFDIVGPYFQVNGKQVFTWLYSGNIEVISITWT